MAWSVDWRPLRSISGKVPSLVAETTDVTIRNDLADIAVLRDAVDRVGANSRIPSATLYDLQIVLDEIVSNVIKYAWPAGGAHEVRVRLTVDRDAIFSAAPGSSSHGDSMPGVCDPCPGASNAITCLREHCGDGFARCNRL